MSTYTNTPNINHLDMNQCVEPALEILNAMMADECAALRAIQQTEFTAIVLRTAFQSRLMSKFNRGQEWVKLLETKLVDLGRVDINDFYILPVSTEQAIARKFFCTKHGKYKAIPYQDYSEGQAVNYTVAGRAAYTKVGHIQQIQHNLLIIATATKNIKRSKDDVTPIWAPSPLMYSLRGKCWCEVESAQ